MPFVLGFYGTCEDGTGGAGSGGGGASAPGQVTGLTVSSTSSSELAVSWNSVSGATSYKVERSTSSGSGFSQILNSPSTSIGSTGLSQGTQYYFRVRASNSNGDGPYSSEASNYTRPGQITGLSASVTSSSQINLSWNNPTGYETGYQVYRSTASNMAGQALVGTAIGTSSSVTGLNASTTYYFRVRGVNAGGVGAYSSITNATTQSGGGSAPSAVSIATSSSGNYNDAVIIANTETSAQWINENGSNFSSRALQLTVPTAFSTVNAYEYAVYPQGTTGYTLVEIKGYIRATGATSFQWDVGNFSENSGGISSISNITEGTSQNATSTAAITFRVNGVSGGRGFLPWASGQTLEFTVDATATNTHGSTTAAQLAVELTGSG